MKRMLCVRVSAASSEAQSEKQSIQYRNKKRPRAFAISNGMRLFIYIQPKKNRTHNKHMYGTKHIIEKRAHRTLQRKVYSSCARA